MRAYPRLYSEAVPSEARGILAKAEPMLGGVSDEERERFRNVELGLEHGDLLVEALEDGAKGLVSEGPGFRISLRTVIVSA